MQVTLSTGRTVEIAPLTMGQLRRMTELVAAGRNLDATVNAAVDSMRNAADSGAPIDPAQFEESFTVPEANELFIRIAEVSGITLGEAKAMN